MVSDVVKYSQGKYNLKYCSNDADWMKAILAYHAESKNSEKDKKTNENRMIEREVCSV